MEKNDKFESISYKKHDDYFNIFAEGEEKHKHAQAWLNNKSVDFWRHERFYAVLNPLISHYQQADWLTVGDGRYGKDAQWLLANGCNVIASDISGVLLKEAFDAGLLTSYQIENAEALSFPDNHFDFVLCKDAYHHFPRPMYALYELLRVARKGVVLMEPSDHILANRPLDKIVSFLSRMVRKILKKPDISCKDYEDFGNYVYRLSRREIEKVALGLNYPVIAFRGINDFYQEGMSGEAVEDNGIFFRRARFFIGLFNILAKLKIRDYRILTAIIFKDEITESLKADLSAQGYDVIELSRNPYA